MKVASRIEKQALQQLDPNFMSDKKMENTWQAPG